MSADTDLVSEAATRLEWLASARAQHPSSRSPSRDADRPSPDPGSQPGRGHLAAVKPIRPPAAPEAWSAGLWGSFA